MRILVTGGAGYIGSITTRMLLDAGHEAVVLDTLERGYRAAVDPRAEFIRGDAGDPRCLDQVLPDCDAVMHLAGYIEVAESQKHPGRYFANNVAGPLELLEAMIRHGVGRLCFSSTAAVYGEPDRVPLTEEAPVRPINAYGASKLMFEQLLEWYGRLHGLRSVRFRYFNVAGAWPDGSLGEAHDPETHILPRILKAMASGQTRFEIYGSDYPTPDGTCIRDYIHVMDLGLAHRLGLEWLGEERAGGPEVEADGGSESGCGLILNLGTGRGFSNLEVVRACAEVTGVQIQMDLGPRRPGDPARLVASSERAGRVLGWRPERSLLEQMVADAWRWHRAHPDGFPE
ncbi:MAG: UDP-glucose 4-epimerase GalE [Thermoleophilia bacterium]